MQFILVLTSAAVALAAPVCMPGTLANYVALTNGCTIGPPPTFTFSNFSFSLVSSSGSPTILTANDIDVTPMNSVPSELTLQFSSSGFNVGNGQTVEYVISYLVDPPPPEIIHFRSSLNIDPPPPIGLALVSTELCDNAEFVGTVCPSGLTDTLTVFQSGATSVLSDTADFSGVVAELGVINTITLNGGGAPSDPAGFSSFTNTVITSVPEPANAFVGACGIGLIVFLARRVHTKFR
jgi:hypothetical protein